MRRRRCSCEAAATERHDRLWLVASKSAIALYQPPITRHSQNTGGNHGDVILAFDWLVRPARGSGRVPRGGGAELAPLRDRGLLHRGRRRVLRWQEDEGFVVLL